MTVQILGALTFEYLGLKMNPKEQKIESVEMWLLNLKSKATSIKENG